MLVTTGALMTASDLELFLGSTLYRTKLAVIAVLVLNGGLLVSIEAAASRSNGETSGRLPLVAATSGLLWLGALFLGTWLTVGASSL